MGHFIWTEAMCESGTTTNECRRCSERLIGVRELASMLSISPKSVRNRLSLGTFEIPARKLGGRVLFLQSEIHEFMKSLPQMGERQDEGSE